MAILVPLFLLLNAVAAQAGADGRDGCAPSALDRLQKDFVEIAGRVKPSVVEIRALKISTKQTAVGPSSSTTHIQETTVLAGVVLRKDGHIVTIAEPVVGAKSIHVRTSSGVEYPATIVGADEETGLAVIKVNAPLEAIALAADEEALVGSLVAAVGNSYGMAGSVSFGTLSGSDRTIESGKKRYAGLLQYTATVNPGDAGGLISNIKGDCIGIIFSSMELRQAGGVPGFGGIGFAVPAGTVRFVADSLISDRKVLRGWLGITMSAIDPNLRAQLNLKNGVGAVVTQIDPGSPAEKAGFKPHDIILEASGRELLDARKLMMDVIRTRKETAMKFRLLRGGTPLDIEALITVR
ncbi:MAG: hypothetical protein A2Z34_07805 [Planctomycetes bacterium RBG_16_59_8]|nr:MAG: hypothetical protein A2Z34_07805 [Planctomycetes bacterium RBG_16_59_8]